MKVSEVCRGHGSSGGFQGRGKTRWDYVLRYLVILQASEASLFFCTKGFLSDSCAPWKPLCLHVPFPVSRCPLPALLHHVCPRLCRKSPSLLMLDSSSATPLYAPRGSDGGLRDRTRRRRGTTGASRRRRRRRRGRWWAAATGCRGSCPGRTGPRCGRRTGGRASRRPGAPAPAAPAPARARGAPATTTAASSARAAPP